MNLREHTKPFKALGNERRLQILLMLLKKSYRVSDIAYHLQITVKGASKHMQLLENAGLALRTRTGKSVYYRANVGKLDLRILFNYLKSFRINK